MSARVTAAELLTNLVRARLEFVGASPAILKAAAITADDLAVVKRDLQKIESEGRGGKGVVGSGETRTGAKGSLNDMSTAITPTPSPSADALEVFEHWRTTYEKPKATLTPAILEAIQVVLAHPLSVAEVKKALDLVRDNPGLIKRRQPRPNITTVLRSPKLVCSVLGIKYAAPKVSWLEPFDLIWQKHYGASLPFGIAAKVLKPLVDRHGTSEVEQRFDNFCAQTPAAYVSIPKFGATYGTWTSAVNVRTPVREARRDAARMVEGL